MNGQGPGTLHNGDDNGVSDNSLLRRGEVEGGAVDAISEQVRPVQLLAHPVEGQALH